MKRYDIFHYNIMGTGERDQLEIEEAVDGEWVDYADAQAAIEAARAEEREAMIRLVEAVADYWTGEKADAARRIGDAMKAIHEGMKEDDAIRSMGGE